MISPEKSKQIHTISKIINDCYVEDPLTKIASELGIYLNVDYEDISLIKIIKNVKNIADKNFIASIMLRLYKRQECLIEDDKNLKRETVTLFDNVYADLYVKLKISSKTQTHEKLPLLVNYLEKAESITKQLEINDLKKLKIFKEVFLKNFNGQYKDLLTIFLDETVYSKVNSIIELTNKYNKTPNLQTYSDAKNILTENINLLREVDSEYNNKFLLNPLSNMLKLINNDFGKNPDSQPSKIIITSTGKKYPLHIKDKTFKLILRLKNIENGKAYDAKVKIIKTSKNVKIEKSEQFVGVIEGHKVINVEFDALVLDIEKDMSLNVLVEYNNYTKKIFREEKRLLFNAQKANIDWDELEKKDAYSIEAIDTEDELIGRTDILGELYKGLNKQKNINSYYIFGQKRVGKTSIAKALMSKLQKDNTVTVLYIEAGESIGSTFVDTVKNLGDKICKQLKRIHKKELRDIEIPIFNDSIQPLADFLDDVSYELGNQKIIFILDEFDQISSELYKRTNIGSAFFLTIRSLSNKSNYSFILVGGEKIEFIISMQGQQLNKFNSQRIDYFDKEDWSQFKELVQKPVKGYIDITDEAIDRIYDETAGNPFFTNTICKQMLSLAIEKKDSHITDIEINIAIEKALKYAGTQKFLHFWEDGIREDKDKEEEVSYKRRSVLLSLATIEKEKKQLKKQFIIDNLINEFEENEIIRILKEFVDRRILIEREEIYEFRINFFKEWLFNYGCDNIIMTLSDEQKIKKRAKEEKEAKISAKEMNDFINEVKPEYSGHKITSDDIREYLIQFGSNIEQRLIFEILNKTTYYDVSNIKSRMKMIFEDIKRNLLYKENNMTVSYSSGRKVTNILVSGLDGIAKSSVTYAKYFGEENNILAKNIIEKDKIIEKLKDKNLKTIVFIDDFVGTGTSIIENVKYLKDNFSEIFTTEISIYIGVITGFQTAKEYIEQELIKMKIFNVTILLSEPLNDTNKCFSDASKIFINPNKRRDAEDLCWKKGSELVSRNPLGYGDCQATVIFPDTCPNNCLPILWYGEKKNFKPLFKRVIH
ncbi:MAG: putative AAA+ superfamily ATPase [Sulfurimonas sp.]|jgi:predicted AAA+ superfamily ATPase